MPEKVLVEIEIDEKGAVKSLGKIDKEIDNVSDSAAKAQKKTTGLGKAFKGVGVAVRGVGAALKAAGIGIIIGLVSKFTEVLLQNQQVMDGLNKAFNTISIIFQQLTKPLFEVGAAISENAEGFDALLRVGKNLLTIVLAPLKLGFIELQAIVLGVQLAWEKSFLGNNDEDRIKELQSDLSGLTVELAELGASVVNAGKAIGEDFTEAVSEAGAIFGQVSDAVVEGFNDIDLAAAASGAAAIDAAKKRNQLLELEQVRLRERFDLEAELQRQIRDDVSKTIETRIAANTKLGEVLNEQAEMEAANIRQRIASTELQNKLLGVTQERTLEIFSLQTELEEISARVAGFRSEQLTNENSLLLEQKEILQSKKDTEIEVAEIQRVASNDLLISETERIHAQMALEAELNAARMTALDERLLAETEGTAAYQNILNERALLDANFNANKLKQEDALAKAEIDLEKKVQATKLNIIGGALSAAQSLVEEGSKAAKGIAVAQATISAIQSINSILAAPSTIPEPYGSIAKGISAAAVGASAFANVKKILATKTDGGGASASSGSVSSGPSAPSVGQAISLTNPNNGNENISDSIQQGFNGSNMRAYVVGSDVSGQQQLDREIAQNATFG